MDNCFQLYIPFYNEASSELWITKNGKNEWMFFFACLPAGRRARSASAGLAVRPRPDGPDIMSEHRAVVAVEASEITFILFLFALPSRSFSVGGRKSSKRGRMKGNFE